MSRSERIHLAQELHDGIAQDLVGFGYSLDLLLAQSDTPNSTRAELRKLRFTITDLLEKVRGEIHQLHKESDIDVSQGIIDSAKEFCHGLNLTLDVSDLFLEEDGEKAYGIIQIARELLRNISTHAQATQVHIALTSRNDLINLRISDDGIGGAAENSQRFGIVGAKTRALNLGGTLTIEPLPKGTRAELRIPLSHVMIS